MSRSGKNGPTIAQGGQRLGKRENHARVIQALHLAQSGYHEGAIELLDRLLVEFPEKTQVAQAHAQKADSLAKLGHTEGAISEYRRALQSERDFPNVRTNAWLDFGWFVVEKQLTHYYDEVSEVLNEFREESGFTLPLAEYRYCAIQSLLADARGNNAAAQGFAKAALAQAALRHSGLRYHPTVGLVGTERGKIEIRLRMLADS